MADLPTHHDAVPVAVRGLVAPVDAKMAELVYLLWKFGIPTVASCEDTVAFRLTEPRMRDLVTDDERQQEPLAYVVFPSVEAIQACAHLLSSVMVARGPGKWWFDVSPRTSDGDLWGSIYFPQAQIPQLVREARDFLQRAQENEETKHAIQTIEWVSPPHT
uniref:hypothetical protein n=1 Tax=Streptosporangium sp. CA-235898 TaxID=3240073 RepID=UPI003F4946D7